MSARRIAALLLLAATARADVLHVPGEFPTVQEAVRTGLDIRGNTCES